jgi:VWFA-related protein
MLSRRTLLFGSALKLWPQDAKFSTDVNVVTLLATVHDRDGRVIKNLEREDFVLQDEGRPQAISYFTRETDLPLQIGLLVDTSRSQRGVLGAEKRASYKFLEQVLREDKDRAFVARFDIDVEVTQGFTSSKDVLRTALNTLEIPGRTATLLYEAVRKVSEEQMRKETGRKAYIILSDGVSFKDPVSIGTAIEFAQRADVIIFSILFSQAQLRPARGRAHPRALRGKKVPGGRDGRRILRGDGEASDREDLCRDRGRAAQSVQHRVHAGVARQERAVSEDQAGGSR